jgi:hypothetical protein
MVPGSSASPAFTSGSPLGSAELYELINARATIVLNSGDRFNILGGNNMAVSHLFQGQAFKMDGTQQ